MQCFDAIVIGCGGVGGAALYELARRGARALGIDRFPPGHGRGSSHGSSRIIRQAYFEHPDYVPLLLRAYDLWNALEARVGERLYDEVGLVEAGPSDGVVIPGVRTSARRHGLEIEELTAGEARRRWPALFVPDEMAVVFERHAGYLRVESKELPVTREVCHNRRRDFFMRYFINIPQRIYDGTYTLKLTIEDVKNQKFNQASIKFEVQGAN
jgi:glycine/D-amino acid oxidase-like deaminating enzyme